LVAALIELLSIKDVSSLIGDCQISWNHMLASIYVGRCGNTRKRTLATYIEHLVGNSISFIIIFQSA